MRHNLLRTLYALLLGLIGAAIVHIAIILLVPGYASEILWKRVSALGAPYAFHRITGEEWAKRSDPMMRSAVCRFDLSDGPVHISAIGKVPYWSMAIYNHQGDITFSLNDQISPAMDILVVTPLQKILFEQATPPRLAESAVIQQNISEGIAVLRIFEPDDTWRDEVAEFMKSAECMPVFTDN